MGRSGGPKVITDHFLTMEVARLTGLSKYMVDYLCRHGILTASLSKSRGHGRHRRFSFTDILLGRAIKHLLDAGVSVLALRRALGTLRDVLHRDFGKELREHRVVIKGGVPLLCEQGASPVDLIAKGQLVFGFMIETQELRLRATKVRELRERRIHARVQRAWRVRRERLA
jgi:DNA-binding transcriptional MerR regulator